jgi:NADH:ubiquinone reductase (H+-translocating)
VASIGPLRFGGFIAWVLWLIIHVMYLVGFKNRITTVLHWAVSFIGRGRAQRTTTYQQIVGRTRTHAALTEAHGDTPNDHPAAHIV